jgi:hypothetical protein
VAVSAWIEIEMQVVASELTVNQLDTSQLNDTISALCREAGGFGV